MLKDDEQPIVIAHYPRTVNIAAGKILGVYGMRARQCVTALIARLAVEIGPADWQLIFASYADDEWKFLEEFVQVRSTPLDRFDLESAGYENKHRLILVHEKETIANRTSIARRILPNQNVSMIVVARSVLTFRLCVATHSTLMNLELMGCLKQPPDIFRRLSGGGLIPTTMEVLCQKKFRFRHL